MTTRSSTSLTSGEIAISYVHDNATPAALRPVVEISIDHGTSLSAIATQVFGLASILARSAGHQLILIRLRSTENRSFFECMTTQEANRWERAVRSLERLDAVTIIELSGHCGGPALDLMLACDYRLAATDLELSLPTRDGRFWPGMTLYRLVQQIGLTHARRLLLRCDTLSVEQCVELGLIDGTATWPMGLMRVMRHGATSDFSVRRRLLAEALSTSYDDALGTHLAACDRELRKIREAHDDHHDPI